MLANNIERVEVFSYRQSVLADVAFLEMVKLGFLPKPIKAG
jgi:hypothetical protein